MSYDYSLVIRAATNVTTNATSTTEKPASYKVVGIVLAVCSGLFIGTSFVLKKMGLLKANAKYQEEAGEGYGYLKNAWWWSGMTLMIVGEICNFVAYAFVDAILVTPLGALSVVITTILSAIFLKERLSFVGKAGCFNCIVGSVVIVLNAPTEASAATIEEMQHFVIAPGFLSYAGVIIVGCVFTALWAGPRYGKKSMLVYITICSLIGGLSVVCLQGLGSAIVTQIRGTPQFNHWFIYVLMVFVITTLVTEIIYLNKALNIFNAALVTPTYYVYFTSATIVSSAVLFRGFKGTASEITTIVMGFLQICTGVVLLQLSKSAKDVPDAAVLKGDLDQMRTVAEQEDPESEPKADAIRGTAALIRSFSKARRHREVDEAKRVYTERMEPIRENEHVEWDGLRRRKTIIEPGQSGIQRRKSIHPPLGLTHFPNEDQSVPLAEMHTAFPTSQHNQGQRHGSASSASTMPHIFGLPASLRPTVVPVPRGLSEFAHADTEYKSPANATTTVHFTPSTFEHSQRDGAGTGLSHRTNEVADDYNDGTPLPPPHASFAQEDLTARRQFSFSNVFGRGRRGSEGEERRVSGTSSAVSRFGLKGRGGGGSHQHTVTEEERLGLVKGDSNMPGHHGGSTGQTMLGREVGEGEEYESPVEEDEEEERLDVRRSRVRGYADVAREDDESDEFDDRHDDFGFEKIGQGRYDRGGTGGQAFV